MKERLRQLYDAVEEDLLFRIGEHSLPGGGTVPSIEIHYPGWSREKLALVRGSMLGGVTFTTARRPDGFCDVCLATREQITIQCREAKRSAMAEYRNDLPSVARIL